VPNYDIDPKVEKEKEVVEEIYVTQTIERDYPLWSKQNIVSTSHPLSSTAIVKPSFTIPSTFSPTPSLETKMVCNIVDDMKKIKVTPLYMIYLALASNENRC